MPIDNMADALRKVKGYNGAEIIEAVTWLAEQLKRDWSNDEIRNALLGFLQSDKKIEQVRPLTPFIAADALMRTGTDKDLMASYFIEERWLPQRSLIPLAIDNPTILTEMLQEMLEQKPSRDNGQKVASIMSALSRISAITSRDELRAFETYGKDQKFHKGILSAVSEFRPNWTEKESDYQFDLVQKTLDSAAANLAGSPENYEKGPETLVPDYIQFLRRTDKSPYELWPSTKRLLNLLETAYPRVEERPIYGHLLTIIAVSSEPDQILAMAEDMKPSATKTLVREFQRNSQESGRRLSDEQMSTISEVLAKAGGGREYVDYVAANQRTPGFVHKAIEILERGGPDMAYAIEKLVPYFKYTSTGQDWLNRNMAILWRNTDEQSRLAFLQAAPQAFSEEFLSKVAMEESNVGAKAAEVLGQSLPPGRVEALWDRLPTSSKAGLLRELGNRLPVTSLVRIVHQGDPLLAPVAADILGRKNLRHLAPEPEI